MPDPAAEIRMTTLHATRGANFWSRRPVTRLDLTVGPYDDISSAEAPGFTEALVAAMPGLVEHRCSIGERGGFVMRLHRGTYAPHIVEHVALELQTMIGHEVGFGRTRGGDSPGEYTLVFEHVHEGVGLRAAALALEAVQRAFAGTLDDVSHATAELAAIALTPDVPRQRQRVLCGITGSASRAETRDEILRHSARADDLIVDVSPAYILQQGLPYARSQLGIVLDSHPTDVPERYQDPERSQRLMSVLADAVVRDGVVIAPAKAWEIQDYARDEGCRVAIFATDGNVTARDKRIARAVACVSDGRIVLERFGECTDAGPLDPARPAAPQVAGALAVFTLRELAPTDDTPPSTERRADA